VPNRLRINLLQKGDRVRVQRCAGDRVASEVVNIGAGAREVPVITPTRDAEAAGAASLQVNALIRPLAFAKPRLRFGGAGRPPSPAVGRR
jgi:hypothetical protein